MEEFVFYWVEGKCNPLCPVHHFVFNISSMPRPPKVSLPFMLSIWNFVCIFNFSNPFLLSHLSHCLAVHLPPPFTDQYKSCSPSQCNSVLPPANPSLFRPNISLSPCSTKISQFLFYGTQTQTHTNTNTHHRTHLVLCNRNCLFTTPTCCVKSVSFVWTTVYDMRYCKWKIRWKILMQEN
jgi:hypothetical protein